MNGEWWIEDREDLPEGDYEPPEHTVAGTLNDSGTDKWTLDTIGGVRDQPLHDRSGRSAQLMSGPATIWGVTANHKAVSLLSCYTVETTVYFQSPREGTERWQVGSIVVGNGIWVDPDTVVDEITIEYQDLAAWTWDRNDRGSEPDFTKDGTALSVPLVGKVKEARTREYPVHLSWSRRWNLSDGPINIRPTASFTIEDSLRIADVADKWVFPIGQLLSLLVLSHCGVTGVRARIANGGEDSRAKYILLRFPQASTRTIDEETAPGPLGRQLDMLATRTDLEDRGTDLTALLSAFYDLKDNPKLSDALSHFLDSQAKEEAGEVDEALRCLFNAFENLHAVRYESAVQDSEELENVLKELVSKAPSEHRNEISLRLNRRRSKSIKQMLEDLVDDCGEVASRVLRPRPELVAHAGTARNEIAHANPRSASRWKRHLVLMDLQWLMRHAFLQLLGVQKSDCDDIFRQVGRPFGQYVGHQ